MTKTTECRETKKYRTIVIDPPWDMPRTGLTESKGMRRAGEVYPTIPDRQMVEVRVNDFAAEQSHLWIWAPDEKLDLTLDLIRWWGFKRHRTMVWDKGSGIGNYIRLRTEFLIFAYRGKLEPRCRSEFDNVIETPRGRHSEKPAESYRRISRFSRPPFAELFARPRPDLDELRRGWDLFGYDSGGEDLLDRGSGRQAVTLHVWDKQGHERSYGVSMPLRAPAGTDGEGEAA